MSGGVCLDSGLEGVWRGLYLEVGGGVPKDGTYGGVCLEGCVWRGVSGGECFEMCPEGVCLEDFAGRG